VLPVGQTLTHQFVLVLTAEGGRRSECKQSCVTCGSFREKFRTVCSVDSILRPLSLSLFLFLSLSLSLQSDLLTTRRLCQIFIETHMYILFFFVYFFCFVVCMHVFLQAKLQRQETETKTAQQTSLEW